MKTYQFDISVVVDADDEDEAMEEAMQRLSRYTYVREGATITVIGSTRYEVEHFLAGNDTRDHEVAMWAVVDSFANPETDDVIVAVHTDAGRAAADAAQRNLLAPMFDRIDQAEAVDPWAENPTYTVEDWAYEVSNNETRLGYQDWVANKIEAAAETGWG